MRNALTTILSAGALLGALAGSVVAQAPATPPPAASAPAPKATVPPPTAPTAAKEKGKAPPKTATTPEGVTCSAEADAKGLKGKERKTFRRKCIAEIKKAAKGGTPAKSAPAPKG